MTAAQTYHHGNLRQALLDTALDHLNTVGPDKLSLRALARDVGVSQTAPYRHFEDKKTLLASIAAEGFRKLYDATRVDLASMESISDCMVQSGKAYIAFAIANPALYKLMFGPEFGKEHEFEELRQAGNQSFGVIVSIVTEGVRRGEFIKEDPMLLANMAWANVHGIASLILDGRFDCVDTEITDRFLEDMLATNLRGIAVR